MSKYTDPMPERECGCSTCGQVLPPLSCGIPHYCEPKRQTDPPLTEAEATEFWRKLAEETETTNEEN